MITAKKELLLQRLKYFAKQTLIKVLLKNDLLKFATHFIILL